jgi:hypothetical protein
MLTHFEAFKIWASDLVVWNSDPEFEFTISTDITANSQQNDIHEGQPGTGTWDHLAA